MQLHFFDKHGTEIFERDLVVLDGASQRNGKDVTTPMLCSGGFPYKKYAVVLKRADGTPVCRYSGGEDVRAGDCWLEVSGERGGPLEAGAAGLKSETFRAAWARCTFVSRGAARWPSRANGTPEVSKLLPEHYFDAYATEIFLGDKVAFFGGEAPEKHGPPVTVSTLVQEVGFYDTAIVVSRADGSLVYRYVDGEDVRLGDRYRYKGKEKSVCELHLSAPIGLDTSEQARRLEWATCVLLRRDGALEVTPETPAQVNALEAFCKAISSPLKPLNPYDYLGVFERVIKKRIEMLQNVTLVWCDVSTRRGPRLCAEIASSGARALVELRMTPTTLLDIETTIALRTEDALGHLKEQIGARAFRTGTLILEAGRFRVV